MKYLIDTNICIYIMNKRPLKVIKKFKEFGIGMIGVSIITISELEYGVAKSKHIKKNRKRLNEFLSPFDVLLYNEKASEYYGTIRADLEEKGLIIGPLDMLIAAHALSENLILVTNNEKEFKRVKGLRVENWAK